MKKQWLLIPFVLLLYGCSSLSSQDKPEPDSSTEEYETAHTTKVDSIYSLSPSMREIRSTVINFLGDNYWPNTLYSSEEFAERTGISENMYNSFLAEYEHTEAGTDLMIVIDAKEESLPQIETRLNDYRNLLLRIFEQQPQNHAKVAASRIEIIDHYICFVQLGADITSLKDKGEAEMISYCQNENEKALDIIEKKILNDIE